MFKIKHKMILIYGLVIILSLGIMFSVNLFFLSKIAKEKSLSEMEKLSEALLLTTKTAIDNSIKNYLRGIAEKGLELAKYFYLQYMNGVFSQAEAKRRYSAIILDKGYGLIGKTGYLAIVNGKGVLEIHPISQGVNAIKFDFMKRATKQKNGYLEYKWKNKGEVVERDKVSWLSYFEPWDYIVWASSYKSEFLYLLNLDEIKKEILKIKVGQTGYPYIIDTNGNFIAHPNREGQTGLFDTDIHGKKFIKEIIEKKNGSITYYYKSNGSENEKEKIISFRYLPEMNWIIAVGTYTDEIFGDVKKARNISILIMIINILLIIPIVLILTARITRPIEKSVKILTEIAKGISNGEVDLSNEFFTKSKDEIGQLSDSLNTFFHKIREVILGLKNSSNDVGHTVQSLTGSVDKSTVMVNEIVNSINTVYKNLDEQNAVVEETSATIIEMVSAINSLVNNIYEQSSAIEESSASVEQMAATISSVEITAKKANEISSNLHNVAREGGVAIQKAVDSIREIEQSSNQITEIIQIITNIAEQTNLLAMNAAIEAAHAGDYGKGFAVVADEIRKLAENSSSSGKEITNLIKAIATKITKTAELASSAIDGLGKILNDVNETNKINSEIVSAMNEQSVGVKEVLKSITKLVSITDNVKNAIDEQKIGSTEITKVVTHLEEITKIILEETDLNNERSTKVKEAISEMKSVSMINKSVFNKMEEYVKMFKLDNDTKGITIKKG